MCLHQFCPCTIVFFDGVLLALRRRPSNPPMVSYFRTSDHALAGLKTSGGQFNSVTNVVHPNTTFVSALATAATRLDGLKANWVLCLPFLATKSSLFECGYPNLFHV